MSGNGWMGWSRGADAHRAAGRQRLGSTQGLGQEEQQPGVQTAGKAGQELVAQGEQPPPYFRATNSHFFPDGSSAGPRAPAPYCPSALALAPLLPFIELTACPLPSQTAWYDGS